MKKYQSSKTALVQICQTTRSCELTEDVILPLVLNIFNRFDPNGSYMIQESKFQNNYHTEPNTIFAMLRKFSFSENRD